MSNDKMVGVVEALMVKSGVTPNANDALKLSQAALNVAHALQVLEETATLRPSGLAA